MFLTHKNSVCMLAMLMFTLLSYHLPPIQAQSSGDSEDLIAWVNENGLNISFTQSPTSSTMTFEDIDIFDGDLDKWWLLSPYSMQVSPDRGHLALSVVKPHMYRLFIIDISTGSRHEVTLPYPATIQWSPDSRSIFINLFQSLYVDAIYTISSFVPGLIYDYDSDTLTTLSVDGISDSLWSPDSGVMFFVAQNPGSESGQDIYRISRDGSNLQRLTDISEVVDIDADSGCGPLAYRLDNQRIYFSGKCSRFAEPTGSILSVSEIGGDVRAESSLDEITTEDVTGVSFAVLEDIAVFEDEVYLSFDAYVFSDLGNRRVWRIIRINDSQANDVVFDYRLGPEFTSIENTLEIMSFSPTGQFGALTGYGQIVVVDTKTNNILLETEFTDERVCSFQWQDDVNLLYEVSNKCQTSSAESVREIPGRVYSFNVETQTVELLAGDSIWIVPIANCSPSS